MASEVTLSVRRRLAQLAAQAAASVDGAAGLHPDPGSAHVIEVAGDRLDGLSVLAAGQGRYDVTLCVAARPVPLHDLAERLRAQVHASAARENLAEAIGHVEIRVTDIVVEEPA